MSLAARRRRVSPTTIFPPVYGACPVAGLVWEAVCGGTHRSVKRGFAHGASGDPWPERVDPTRAWWFHPGLGGPPGSPVPSRRGQGLPTGTGGGRLRDLRQGGGRGRPAVRPSRGRHRLRRWSAAGRQTVPDHGALRRWVVDPVAGARERPHRGTGPLGGDARCRRTGRSARPGRAAPRCEAGEHPDRRLRQTSTGRLRPRGRRGRRSSGHRRAADDPRLCAAGGVHGVGGHGVGRRLLPGRHPLRLAGGASSPEVGSHRRPAGHGRERHRADRTATRGELVLDGRADGRPECRRRVSAIRSRVPRPVGIRARTTGAEGQSAAHHQPAGPLRAARAAGARRDGRHAGGDAVGRRCRPCPGSGDDGVSASSPPPRRWSCSPPRVPPG